MTAPAGRSRDLMVAISASLVSRGVTLLAPLLIMPAMLGLMGPSVFGVWVTGTSVISLAAFMDFGIGNSLLTRLAVQFGRAEHSAARRSIGAAYRILGLVALGGLALLMLGLLVLLIRPSDSTAMILVMLLFFVIGVPLSVVYRILYANRQMVLYNVLQIGSAAFSVLFTLSAIWAGLSPLAVAAVFAAVPVGFMLAASLWVYAAFPAFRPARTDFAHGIEGRDLLHLGLGHLWLGILTAVGMNIDIPLILYTLGPEAVTAFALPSRIGLLMLAIVATVFMPLWSFNGAAMARQDYDWVRRNTFRMSVGGGLAILVLGGVLTLGIDLIMRLWVGQAFADQRLVVAAMTVASTVIAVTSPYNMVLNAAGKVRVQIGAWAAFVGLSVLGKLWLIPVLGPWSVSMVTALVYVACVTPAMILTALAVTSRHRPHQV